jgi:tetratricopeptide (TPR) repeat protein
VWSAAVSVFVLLAVGLVGLGIGNVMVTKERDEKDAALRAKTKALEERDRAYTSAEAERRRAEGNLDLALSAMDAVYLDAIGQDKLLCEPVARPDAVERPRLDEQPPLTDLERELLKRGLDFYDQFAQKNAAAPRAFVQTAQAYFRVGLLHGALGDTAAAAEAYRGAVERFERLTNEEPDNAEHFRRLGEAYRGLANVVPDWPEAKRTFERARVAYSNAIELKPNDVTLYLSRGRVFETLSDRRAGEDYEKALQLAPDDFQGHLKCSYYYASGTIAFMDGLTAFRDLEKSRDHAERAVALAPDDPQCHLQLASVLALAHEDTVIMPIGRPFIRIVRDAGPALEHYARAIELTPNRPEGYRARGEFYAATGDYHRALADLNRALELDPGDHSGLRNRAMAYAGLEQFEKALADLATLTDARPHDARAHFAAGEAHMGMGSWQAGVDELSKAAEIQPLWWLIYKRRAMAYLNLGQYADALADLKEALDIWPGETSTLCVTPPSHIAKAPEDFRQGLVALANNAVERFPGSVNYARRGYIHAQMGEYEKAETDFARALELAPKGATAWYLWGRSCAGRGRHREAREKFSKATEFRPDSWLFWSRRAWASLRLEDFAAAVADFSKVLELYPSRHQARTARCVAYLRLGQVEKARDDVGALLESDTKTPRDYFCCNVLCLALHDQARYRESCQTMLDALAETGVPSAANFAAWSCSLAPDAVDDYESPIALAAKAVEAQPDSDRFLNTLGAILYRAGRHDEAIQRLTELDRRMEEADRPADFSPAYIWYFLAMSHQEAGNAEQAREYLEKANQLTDKVLADEENPPAWNRQATLELLRKEAESLLGTNVAESAESGQKPDRETSTNPKKKQE